MLGDKWDEWYSQLTGRGWVSGHGLGWKVKVRIGAIQEGLPPLTVREIGLQHKARAWTGLGLQRTAAHRQPILNIKTEERKTERKGSHNSPLLWMFCCIRIILDPCEINCLYTLSSHPVSMTWPELVQKVTETLIKMVTHKCAVRHSLPASI